MSYNHEAKSALTSRSIEVMKMRERTQIVNYPGSI